MFKKYGLIGILMIIFVQFVLFFKIEPFATWHIPIFWFGYIFLVDSIVFILKGNSMLSNRPKTFAFTLFLSLCFWLIFEFYNLFLRGWYYIGLPQSVFMTLFMGFLSFMTIMPGIFETWELIRALHLFSPKVFKIKFEISKSLAYSLILIGLIFLVLPFLILSPFMWILIWTGFVFLLDPIMVLLHNEKSLFLQLKKRKINRILSLFIAGYICGFLWEFWNYQATTKWYYTVPILENIKIFEIPAIGFLAYGPFALELYVMYNFVKMLFSKKFWEKVSPGLFT
jgi:hypothetical protein